MANITLTFTIDNTSNETLTYQSGSSILEGGSWTAEPTSVEGGSHAVTASASGADNEFSELVAILNYGVSGGGLSLTVTMNPNTAGTPTGVSAWFSGATDRRAHVSELNKTSDSITTLITIT